MRTFCIANPELAHFLKREPRSGPAASELDLTAHFQEILRRANDFVPSEAGSIFLDDPVLDRSHPAQGQLVLIACFGIAGAALIGTRLPTDRGVVGHVYLAGRGHVTSDLGDDPFFFAGVDGGSGFTTRSVLCAPLRVEGSIIGVIELLNHVGGEGYGLRDLELLEIFAQTISASITNSVDAQRAREMARRDDLTGLFNDRHLHHSLSEIISESLVTGEECALIFLDLDHFKGINDTHGHLAGSRVLSEIGETLRQILPGPALAARYGGDEFVITLQGAGRQEAFWVAETVRKNLESAVFMEHADPKDPENYPALCIRGVLTCSLGVATLHADVLPRLGAKATDPVAAKNELIKLADTCMYEAKDRGRNLTATAWKR